MLLDRSTGFGVGPSINPCTKVIFERLLFNNIGHLDLGNPNKRVYP